MAWARLQRAGILDQLGRRDDALAAYGLALAGFRRAGDTLGQARTLAGRGALHIRRGALRAARRDLRRAERSLVAHRRDAETAQVRHDLGRVAALAGDLPAALRWYDLADEHFARHGGPASALVDRAEVLLLAGLLPEARAAAAAAREVTAGPGLDAVLPRAWLVHAQAALAAEDLAGAREAAAAASAALGPQGPARWRALAEYVAWRCDADDRVADAPALANRLAAAGWMEHAMETRVIAARIALTAHLYPAGDSAPSALIAAIAGGPASASRVSDTGRAVIADLARAVATIPRGSTHLRARAWFGRALLRLHEGDRAAAKRALVATMRLVDEFRDTFGATELRANVSEMGTRPATLGLLLALHDGDPVDVLAWAEQRRATTLRLTQRSRPTPELTEKLGQLRRVMAELSIWDLDPAELERLRRRQRALEETIRRLTWRTPAAASDPRRPITDILADLGDHALVELVQLGGALTAVAVTRTNALLYQVGGADEVRAEASSLQFALRRLARRQGTASALAAARTEARHAAERLDTMILGPARRLIADRPLVLVPTGDLHGLAWPFLPSCRGRSVRVAPSAALWHTALSSRAIDAQSPAGAGRRVLVAATSPRHAEAEVARIGRNHADAVVLTGVRARVADVLAALDGAQVGHLAAHGRFRADNPLLSYLSLADGPLTVHDLSHVHRPPELVVLSACDVGRTSATGFDDMMGFSSSMLSLGTRAVVASVGPVDDEATASLMVGLHDRLRAGAAPADALAAAQQDTDAWASTHSFVCFGAG